MKVNIINPTSEVTVLKERNGRATIIEYKGERYVYQSDSTARGGVGRGKKAKKT